MPHFNLVFVIPKSAVVRSMTQDLRDNFLALIGQLLDQCLSGLLLLLWKIHRLDNRQEPTPDGVELPDGQLLSRYPFILSQRHNVYFLTRCALYSLPVSSTRATRYPLKALSVLTNFSTSAVAFARVIPATFGRSRTLAKGIGAL